jgi:ATP-binding protein involved in chromosome partitioning
MRRSQDCESKRVSKKNQRDIIIVRSAGNGVSTSAVTFNLALSLRNKGFKVGILYSDSEKSQMSNLLSAQLLLSSYKEHSQRIVPMISCGIKLVSNAYFCSDEADKKDGLDYLVENVEWGDLDYLIIGMPYLVSKSSLQQLSSLCVSGALIVTTPKIASETDIRGVINQYQTIGVKVLGLVEDMSYFFESFSKINYYPHGQGRGEFLAKREGISFLGEIPIDQQILRSDKNLSSPCGLALGLVERCYENITSRLTNDFYSLTSCDLEFSIR